MTLVSTPHDIQQAAEALRQGAIGAFPTETVYGLGADAQNIEAVKRVFELKQRPLTHPLIVHIHHRDLLEDWAQKIPSYAYKLAEHFWPGPLTLVLPKQRQVLNQVTGHQDTVALRVPNHPIALELLEAFGGGLCGPSANRFGELSPTTRDMVAQNFESLDFILDGGPCVIGIESTLVKAYPDHVVLLREGIISKSAIETIAECPVRTTTQIVSAPGRHASHYAPRKPLYLVNANELTTWIADRPPHLSLGVLGFDDLKLEGAYYLKTSKDPSRYAQGLYHNLNSLDKSDAEVIVVISPPQTSAWEAIWDRLQRAAHKTARTKTN